MLIKKFHSIFYIIYFTFICLHLILMLNQRIYPFIDLPLHLFEAKIVRDYDNPNNQFKEFYDYQNQLRPNTIHLYLCSSKIFPTVEIANKFYYSLYIIMLPISLLLIIRRLGANILYSLLIFPLMYNYSFCFGFVGYTLSLPITLFIIYLSLKLIDENTLMNRLLLMVLFILVFFMHAMMTLYLFTLYILYCLIINNRNFKELLKNLSIMLPSLIVFIYWWFSSGSKGPGTIPYLIKYYITEFIPYYYRRFEIFYIDNNNLFAGKFGKWLGLFFSFSIIVTFIVSLINKKSRLIEIFSEKRNLLIIVFFTFSLFCSFVLPPEIPLQWGIYQRYSVFFLLSLILLSSILSKSQYNKTKLICFLTIVFFHFILWANYFIQFDKENEGFTKDFLPKNDRDRVLSGWILEPSYGGGISYIHFPNYYLIWNDGIVTTHNIDLRYVIVKRRADKIRLPEYDALIALFKAYDSRFVNMDYFLVRGNYEDLIGKYYPNFKLDKVSGKWMLYKNINKMAK